MAYDIRDIIVKAVDLALKRRQLYHSLLDINPNIRVRTVINTLLIQVEKDVKQLSDLKESISDNIVEEIDFDIYDKISSLIYQFNKSLINPKIRSLEELLEFSLKLEESVYALFRDIQGRLVKDNYLIETQAYLILEEMIRLKEVNIENIKQFVR